MREVEAWIEAEMRRLDPEAYASAADDRRCRATLAVLLAARVRCAAARRSPAPAVPPVARLHAVPPAAAELLRPPAFRHPRQPRSVLRPRGRLRVPRARRKHRLRGRRREAWSSARRAGSARRDRSAVQREGALDPGASSRAARARAAHRCRAHRLARRRTLPFLGEPVIVVLDRARLRRRAPADGTLPGVPRLDAARRPAASCGAGADPRRRAELAAAPGQAPVRASAAPTTRRSSACACAAGAQLGGHALGQRRAPTARSG